MSKSKKTHNNSVWLSLFGLGCIVVASCLMFLFARGKDIALLQPRGYIAQEQFKLLITSTTILVIFATIVLFFIYLFAWKYRETNQKAVHDPNAGRGKLLITTAWVSPIAVCIIMVSVLIPATQRLVPQDAIESDNEQLTIRVIAMRWKWVFLYPEQNIATVNFIQIPVDTPVRFELTADEAPMQSFWIPHLGGMLYAMTEHVNPLNLMAHTLGDYNGGAAEINGRGFSGMNFTTRVSTQEDFDAWADGVFSQSPELDADEYARLLEPSENVSALAFSSSGNRQIFADLLKKYAGSHSHSSAAEEPSYTEHH